VNRPATRACRALFEAAFQTSKQSRDAFVELPPQLDMLMAAASAAIATLALRIQRPYAAHRLDRHAGRRSGTNVG
jgi:hypothetical protein